MSKKNKNEAKAITPLDPSEAIDPNMDFSLPEEFEEPKAQESLVLDERYAAEDDGVLHDSEDPSHEDTEEESGELPGDDEDSSTPEVEEDGPYGAPIPVVPAGAVGVQGLNYKGKCLKTGKRLFCDPSTGENILV